jgi:hypothetical protein
VERGSLSRNSLAVCVKGVTVLMIMGSKTDYPYLLVAPSIEDRGGMGNIPAEDDEAFLLSVAPSLPDLLLQDD